MVVLGEDLERASKFFKKWAKRYISFDDETRKLSYGMAKDSIKGHIIVTRILRAAEAQSLRANSSDLYVVTIDGTLDDGKPDSWSVRFPDSGKFDLWYTTIRNALAGQGLMEPLTFGLPAEDPRNGLHFATVPVEHLHKFALLEKAILYYFGYAVMHSYDTGVGPQEHIIMVGDRNIYVFRPNADVLRCVPIESISTLKGPSDPTSPNAFAVIVIHPSEHDIVLKMTGDLPKILHIIADVYKGVKNSALPIENVTSGPIDQFCEANNIILKPMEGYKMKAMSPTPKSKLKVALDLYQQQHGATYSRTAPKKSKADKAAALAAAQAAGAASGAAGGGASSAATGEADTIDDSLSRMLKRLGLPQYTAILRKQHVDVELLTCMDATDLTNFGIKDTKHCASILDAAADREANGSPSEQSLTAPPATSAPAVGPAATPLPSAAGPTAPQPTAAKKMVIVLDDSDDEDLMPVVNPASPVSSSRVGGAMGGGGPASPLGGGQSVVVLDDSDDDLVVKPPPPKRSINLDDDDDI